MLDDETVARVIARAEQAIAQEAVEAIPAWVLDWIERTEHLVNDRLLGQRPSN